MVYYAGSPGVFEHNKQNNLPS